MSTAALESAPRKKKTLGKFPIWGELFGVTLSLLVIGLYGMLFIISHQAKQEVISNIELQVFLDRHISTAEQQRLQQTLATREWVLNEQGASGVTFVSKDDEARRLIEETGEDFIEFLGENPLRDVLVVRVKPSYVDTAALNTLKSELEAERGIFEVVYMAGIVEQINDNLMRLGLVLLMVAVVLILAVVMLINNTIKLALFSQRFLIRSMQLVGAKHGFVQTPFLRRSFTNGLVAGLLASVLLYAAYAYSTTLFPKLEDLKDINLFLILFASLLVLGALLATWSTWRAVRRYLRMSLDDLY